MLIAALFTIAKMWKQPKCPSTYNWLKKMMLSVFLLAIMIPVCTSSSPAFCMMCSAIKLNKQGDSHRLDGLVSQFGTNPLFHVWFSLLLLDLHTDFSGGR